MCPKSYLALCLAGTGIPGLYALQIDPDAQRPHHSPATTSGSPAASSGSWQKMGVWTVLGPPVLSVAVTHTGNFTQGQTGATYQVTVANAAPAGPTSAGVTVTESLPGGLSLVSIAGPGWSCPTGTPSCTRGDSLPGGSAYPTLTVTVNVGASAPGQLTNQVTVSGGGGVGAAAGDPTVVQPGNSATAVFTTLDSATHGSWKSAYGADGYAIANDSTGYPTYAQIAMSGQGLATWASSTADTRALQKASSPTDRIASAWWSWTSFNFDVNLIDGNSHTVALYAVDWDGANSRSLRIDILDAGSGATLDTRTLSAFSGGQYAVWNLTGHVVIRATALSINGVISGIFFGAAAPAASAAFVKIDSTTHGAWKTAYGGDGFHVANDAVSYPSYAQVALSGQGSAVWANSTADTRALQKSASPTDRTAAAWWSWTSFTFDVNVTDGQSHSVALYALDWDGANGRTLRIDLLDAGSGAVLDTRTLSAFSGGQYVVWTIAGHVVARVTALSVNAVISGIFFGPASTNSTSATIVKVDSTTKGNWKSAYGNDGYQIANDSASLPAYAQVSLSGQGLATWAASTSDTRALQKPASSTDRIASTWWSWTNFTFDVNLMDGSAHPVALYALDWDGANGRSLHVDVLDAVSGATLDTRTLSAFSNGQYVVWNARGHVLIRVTALTINAVISGIFFN